MDKVIDWLLCSDVEEDKIELLCSEVPNLHPLIAQLLIQRGYSSFTDIKTFFNPKLEELNGFGEMKGLAKASRRLIEAIESKQSILLYGDYDVDGTCSVAMMVRFLRSLDANVSYYIPDRYAEGYGVSSQGIDHAIAQKADLLITLDCGITACDKLERATAAGVDVVICDHHLPGKSIPDVFAILNPMQADCPYLGKELCGCGVGFMLLRKVCDDMGYGDLWKDYLDLVAIATCCDIVPLKGVNRILVAYGMEILREERLPGIIALLGELNHAKIDTVSDVVFKIGPRINAAGRLSHAKEAVELLTAEDPNVCKEIAAKINGYNTHRKELDATATQEALAQVIMKDPEGQKASSVVFDPSWNKGIIGIVASRLIESHYRPTIVLTESNGKLTGSARSVSGFNIYNAIAKCSETLEQFGGHAAAAGVTLNPDNLEAFEAAFESAVSEAIEPTSIRPRVHVDAEVNFGDWYNEKFPQFFGQFNRFRPFGPYNMPITLMTKNVLAKDVRLLKNEHLKFKAYQPGDKKRTIDVIGFKMADYYDHVLAGKPINLAYSIEENVWRGNVSIQLQAKAIALVE